MVVVARGSDRDQLEWELGVSSHVAALSAPKVLL